MNILVINHYAGSEKHGMEFRHGYLAQEWVKSGHAVTIVAASYSHLRIQTPELTDEIGAESINGVRYVWVRTSKYKGNGLGRVWSIVQFLSRVCIFQKRIIGQSHPQAVIASSTYVLDNLIARYLALKHQARYICEVKDIWPLTLVELGGIPSWHPAVMLLRAVECYAYKKADIVVTTMPGAVEHVAASGGERAKVRWIPNGINMTEDPDDARFIPPQHNEKLKGLQKRFELIIGYAGALGVANELESLLAAAEILADEPICFVLIGKGDMQTSLQNLSRARKLEHVHFLTPVDRRGVQRVLSFFDGVFLGWKSSPLYRFGVSPNKLLDYMKAAKPIIHAVDTPFDLVREVGCGFSILPENPEAIADAVRCLRNMAPELRRTMGSKGRAYVEKHLTYATLGNLYEACLK
jgi:glycosyltransferase involved in cell wall biosynthesis